MLINIDISVIRRFPIYATWRYDRLHAWHTAVEQVVFADRLLLNKTDLVSEEELSLIESRLRSINKLAPIKRCQMAAVPIEDVLGLKAFSLERVLQMEFCRQRERIAIGRLLAVM